MFNVVENVYTQLKENGRVARGWLGVLIQDVTRELAESFGMDHPHGALIAKVLSDGPAEKAGLEIGDIVVKFNGEKVSFSSDLPPLVGSTPINKTIPVEIIRRSKHKTIQVNISELPTNDEVLANNNKKPSEKDRNLLNIVIKDLTKDEKETLELKDHGVLVEQINQGPAQKAGIRQGDVLLLINNTKIEDATHFNKLVKSLPKGRSIPVLVQRQGSHIFLALKIDE